VTAPTPVLDVRDLEVSVGTTPVVRGVGFRLAPSERLGIVGESGSGKSLTALSIMGLHRDPVRVTGGQVLLGDQDLIGMGRADLERIRGTRVSMIYQDPGSSLNPLMTVGAQIIETIRLHEPVGRTQARERAVRLLDDVGVPDPRRRLDCYPHEFSGGMRQRVMIAISLACRPDVLLCDEPTTALDVTTQSLVINLIDRLCAERGVAVVLITHDLGLAAGFCDNIAVMYAGRIVEHGSTSNLFARPGHPYSAALMSATIDLSADVQAALPAIAGQPPSLGTLTEGCGFRPRCPRAVQDCAVDPIGVRTTEGGSLVRCIRPITREPAADGGHEGDTTTSRALPEGAENE
jgi:oligopeptide/dipeptide ABC transporter ATP-binding protein